MDPINVLNENQFNLGCDNNKIKCFTLEIRNKKGSIRWDLLKKKLSESGNLTIKKKKEN